MWWSWLRPSVVQTVVAFVCSRASQSQLWHYCLVHPSPLADTAIRYVARLLAWRLLWRTFFWGAFGWRAVVGRSVTPLVVARSHVLSFVAAYCAFIWGSLAWTFACVFLGRWWQRVVNCGRVTLRSGLCVAQCLDSLSSVVALFRFGAGVPGGAVAAVFRCFQLLLGSPAILDMLSVDPSERSERASRPENGWDSELCIVLDQTAGFGSRLGH